MTDEKFVADQALAAAQPYLIGTGAEPYAVIPADAQTVSLEDYLPEPIRVRRSATMHTPGDFALYFGTWGRDESRIYADIDQLQIMGLIDEHGMAPSWCSHRVFYDCPLSPEWLAWTKNDKKVMDQIAFAEWLEDRAADIVEPSGTELLGIATAFHVTRKATFSSSAVLQSGEFSIQYSEATQSGSVELPQVIKLGIAPFRDGVKYEVLARLRYRLKEGSLALWYELIDPGKFVDDAFMAIIAEIQETTSDTIYRASTKGL